MNEEKKIYLRLDKDLNECFCKIKRGLALKNDTEVLRLLINWYYKEKYEPKLECFNHNPEGVMILDRDEKRIIQIRLTPEGAWCDRCETAECRHIRFALAQPEIREALLKKT